MYNDNQKGENKAPVKAEELIGSAREELDRIEGTQRRQGTLNSPQSPESPPQIRQEVYTMSIHEIESKVRELRQLQVLVEEAEAEMETIKDQIKAHMGDSEELRAGEYKVTWKPVTSSRLDSKALKAALPDVVERFTKTSTTRRFTVA